MEFDFEKGMGARRFIRNLCFICFGVSAFSNPLDRFNLYNIGFGIVVGLLFGWLFKLFIRGLLSLFNPKLKKEQGKKVIHYVVDMGMMFIAPFALMALMATFYLKWSMTGGFISAGIMAVATASAIEMGKFTGKQQIKNTIITSVISYLFSYIWTFSSGYMAKAPGFIEGGINLLRSILSNGGGSL